MSSNPTFRMLLGTLLVSRDPEDSVHYVKGTNLILHKPDDVGTKWAANDRIRPSGVCHLHESTLEFERNEGVNLQGKRVHFEKWTERTFEMNGITFCVLDESSVVAYEDIEP